MGHLKKLSCTEIYLPMQRDYSSPSVKQKTKIGQTMQVVCSRGSFHRPIVGVAPTEAAPADRFPILKEAFESRSRDRRLLALEACKIGLQPMRMWRRIVGAEYQGLRPEPKQWEPKTYGELWDVYRQVWQLLFSQLERLPADEREKGVAILLEHAPELGQIPTLIDMIVDTVGTLVKKNIRKRKTGYGNH